MHPEAGEVQALGCPIHFSLTATAVTRPAPLLGEHTREVLAEYGYSAAQIDELATSGVVEVAGSHTATG
ncbi:MAG: CoA transferase, partial [Vicinamibacterales bacterium]